MNKKVNGIIYLIIASILFGFMPIWVKLAYTTGLNAYDVSFLRSVIAAVILYFMIRIKHLPLQLNKDQWIPLFVAGVIGYTATILTLYLSYQYVSAGVSTAVHYIFPVLVMLFSFLLYKERLQIGKWIALCISLGGIYIITAVGEIRFSAWGIFLALISAVFFAMYIIAIDHDKLRDIDSLVLAFYVCVLASLTLGILMLFKGSWPPPITLKGLYYVSLVAIFCTTLALIFFTKGVHIIGPSTASILSTLEPIVSLVAGVLILHEPLSWSIVLGSMLVIGSVILISYSETRGGSHSEA